jgi:hypothetical protein
MIGIPDEAHRSYFLQNQFQAAELFSGLIGRAQNSLLFQCACSSRLKPA